MDNDSTGSVIDDEMIESIVSPNYVGGINDVQLIRVIKMMFKRNRELLKYVMNKEHGKHG